MYQPDEAEDRPSELRRTCTASVTFYDQKSVQNIFLEENQASIAIKIFGNLVTVERYKSHQLAHFESEENHQESTRGNKERDYQQKLASLKRDNNRMSAKPRQVLIGSHHRNYQADQNMHHYCVENGNKKPVRHNHFNFGKVILDHSLDNLRFNIGEDEI